MQDILTSLAIAVMIIITIFGLCFFCFYAGFKDGERALSEKYTIPCEAELPRSQRCVLTAVPEEGK